MWKEEEEGRVMPSLVATMSALECTTCVRTHYVRTNLHTWEDNVKHITSQTIHYQRQYCPDLKNVHP